MVFEDTGRLGLSKDVAPEFGHSSGEGSVMQRAGCLESVQGLCMSI